MSQAEVTLVCEVRCDDDKGPRHNPLCCCFQRERPAVQSVAVLNLGLSWDIIALLTKIAFYLLTSPPGTS